jgi:exosortase
MTNPTQVQAALGSRAGILAGGLWAISVALFHSPLAELATLALQDERYSYILLLPAISGFLLWLKHEPFLKLGRHSPWLGIPVLTAGMVIAAASANLGVTIFGVWVVWLGIALLCYGPEAVGATLFPFLFLLLCIPLPSSAMDQLVTILQSASADTTAGLFRIVGIPFQRDGYVFALNTVDIEIAKECSGIRSSMAMFISSILAGHLLLRNGWSRIGFALLSIPVVIFKNAARITGITWLGLNVDSGFFTGSLHNYSGFPFSLLALALLAPTLWALWRMERGPLTTA